MRILVLGGTQFLGRHVVDAALARGHDVTLFNRGQTRPELFPDVEKLRGDRDGDLDALARTRVRRGRRHERLRAAHRARDDRRARRRRPLHVRLVDLGVRRRLATPPTEYVARRASSTEPTEEWREAYGELKALLRGRRARALPGCVHRPRPGLIVGPWDPTGRFTYWPQRIADGGRVLAPAPPDAAAQVIDVRDLAAWIVRAAERGLAGTFNAVDRADDARASCSRRAAASPAATPSSSGSTATSSPSTRSASGWSCRCGCTRPEYARDALGRPGGRASPPASQTRPLEETVRDTLAWVRSGEAPAEPPAGPRTRQRSGQVLDAWLSKE